MGTQGSNPRPAPNQLCPWVGNRTSPVCNGPSPGPRFHHRIWLRGRLCVEQGQDFWALTQKLLEVTFALSSYWSHVLHVPGVCGKSALLTTESYFLSSPGVPLKVTALGLVLVTRPMGVGEWGTKPWQVLIIWSFHKQHPVASYSLFAEICFQPRCSNCVLIWNYHCVDSCIRPVGKWGILHSGEWLLFFISQENMNVVARSPLLVFQYLLHSCERFIWKRNMSILYKNLSIFIPPERLWLKFSIPQRVRAVQTLVYCLCWVQTEPRNEVWLDPCWWEHALTLATRTGFVDQP